MSAHDAYKSSKILTAEPVKITSMLFAGALGAMRKARVSFESGNREVFVSELERACLIIGELRSALDFEQGGEIATNLADLYAYCLRCLVEAGTGDLAKIEEVELHIGRVRDAWDQSIAQLRRDNAGAPGATDVA